MFNRKLKKRIEKLESKCRALEIRERVNSLKEELDDLEYKKGDDIYILEHSYCDYDILKCEYITSRISCNHDDAYAHIVVYVLYNNVVCEYNSHQITTKEEYEKYINE